MYHENMARDLEPKKKKTVRNMRIIAVEGRIGLETGCTQRGAQVGRVKNSVSA